MCLTEGGLSFVTNDYLQGEIPLIIEVGSADIMATLLQLKAEVEELRGTRIKMVFFGASEVHLLAADIGESSPISSQ